MSPPTSVGAGLGDIVGVPSTSMVALVSMAGNAGFLARLVVLEARLTIKRVFIPEGNAKMNSRHNLRKIISFFIDFHCFFFDFVLNFHLK